jgi:hypothetical protein
MFTTFLKNLKNNLVSSSAVAFASGFSGFSINSVIYHNFICRTDYLHAVIYQTLYWTGSAFLATFGYNVARAFADFPKYIPRLFAKIIP